MRLYFNTRANQWLVKFPLQSDPTGWGDFVQIDPLEALHYVERQFEVIYL